MQMLGTWLVAFQDIRPGGGRNPTGRRTESDRTADGIRSDGGRCPTQSARKKAPITAYFELFL